MAAGGSGGRASCPPGIGPGAGGGPGPSANAAAAVPPAPPAPGNAAAAAAAAAAPGPAAPGPPPPGPGPSAQASAGAERAAEEAAGPGAALLREPVYNWQATKPTVKERFAFLFNNEVLCDVHFLVGKGLSSQRIPAHRFVLAVGSAVFDAMFNGGMATTSTEIELPDVEPAAFLALLKFLYSDEVQIGPETVMTTLYTAKKYAVPALEAHCVEFLKKNLRADNAFMLLTQARLFDEPQLASLCLENIDKNTADAITAEGFTDIDLDTLVAVLERDTLGIREVRLFNAVVRWSEAECQRQQLQVTPENKRKVLGAALGLIRFPLMTIEEFAAGRGVWSPLSQAHGRCWKVPWCIDGPAPLEPRQGQTELLPGLAPLPLCVGRSVPAPGHLPSQPPREMQARRKKVETLLRRAHHAVVAAAPRVLVFRDCILCRGCL
ncbi:BTB/POZ domain-containing protein 2 isoform 2-T2 [Trichechus inunguis]